MMHEKVFHFGEETLMLHKKKVSCQKTGFCCTKKSFMTKKQVSAAQKKVSCQKNRFLLHKKKFHVKKTGFCCTKKSFMSKKQVSAAQKKVSCPKKLLYFPGTARHILCFKALNNETNKKKNKLFSFHCSCETFFSNQVGRF